MLDPKISRINGITYLEIPTADPEKSSIFYGSVFDWKTNRNVESTSFSDGTGHVIGHFVSKKASSEEKGIVPYVFVKNIKTTVERIIDAGGVVEKSPYEEGDLLISTFRDPFGNIMGIWQEGHF